MVNFSELKFVRMLSRQGDTNSTVDLMCDEKTGDYYIRKTIAGIDIPLYKNIFWREIKALYLLNDCEYIVRIFDHRTGNDEKTNKSVGCIYMEYISGQTLSSTDITAPTTRNRYSIIKQLLDAVETAHNNEIIHRDISPDNIMIMDNHDIKVIDFGICKIKNMVSSGTTFRFGTGPYSAPEALDSMDSTEKSDIYSIGAVIYYLFTGLEPPQANAFQKMIDEMSGCDVELKPIIKKMTAESPRDRYKDLSVVKKAMEPLFTRILSKKYNAVVTVGAEIAEKMQNLSLIRKIHYRSDELNEIIKSNFHDVHICLTKDTYEFIGRYYKFKCGYEPISNVFVVSDAVKLTPAVREFFNRRSCPINVQVTVASPGALNRLTENDDLEITNTVREFYDKFRSRQNIDNEYNKNYGAWKKFLEKAVEAVRSSVQMYNYASYTLDEKTGVYRFYLAEGVFLGDAVYNNETRFVLENKPGDKKPPVYIGTYESDVLEEDHVIISVRAANINRKLPDSGTICQDYRESTVNYRRQLDALESIEYELDSRKYDLKAVISGVQPPEKELFSKEVSFFNSRLDMTQKSAVKKVLASSSLSIIQGPPGTGKTNVVIEIIRQILKWNSENPLLPEKKILLVSQSHTAVDKMLSDLVSQSGSDLNLIRIGREEKLNDNIKAEFGSKNVIDERISMIRRNCSTAAEPYLKEIGITREQFDDYYGEYEKKLIVPEDRGSIDQTRLDTVLSKTGSESKSRLRMILEIQRKWTDGVDKCDELFWYIMRSTTVIAGTCIGFISDWIVRNMEFDYVVVDEAAKATYPELAVPFSKAEKIVLVGDHKQLPPIIDQGIVSIDNEDADDSGRLTENFFEKLYDQFPEENRQRLTVQYRMHPVIGNLISRVFYDNEILNGVSAEQRRIEIPGYENTAIEWITTSELPESRRYENRKGSRDNVSYKNECELEVIRSKLADLDRLAAKTLNVGVITAYRLQKLALLNMISQQSYKNLNVAIDTVDAFQGEQKEIIIYSTVRSSEKPMIGFLSSEQRLNVSLSRAKSLLIIVGDMDFLSNRRISGNKFPEIIDYIRTTEGCRVTEAGGEL